MQTTGDHTKCMNYIQKDLQKKESLQLPMKGNAWEVQKGITDTTRPTGCHRSLIWYRKRLSTQQETEGDFKF